MGVARGMQQGPSVDAILFARGLAEIGRFIAERGGVERTVFGMAGAGNLFADARDPGSVDYRMGLAALRQGDFRMEEMREAFGAAAGDLTAFEPGYTSLDGDADTWDLQLLPTSAAVDGGDPSVDDVDGTRSDLGAYGGSGGGPW